MILISYSLQSEFIVIIKTKEDGTLKSLSVKQVADILGHTTSEVAEMYYVKKDTSRLVGMTDGFEI